MAKAKKSFKAVKAHHDAARKDIQAVFKKYGMDQYIVTARQSDNTGFVIMEGNSVFFAAALFRISQNCVGI